jgi:hypothetical protein
LTVTLVAPLLDLFGRVSGVPVLGVVALVASAAGSAVLLLSWLRFPRTAWLAAATLAAVASFALRFGGVEVAPLLSLLAVVALGLGGAFASPDQSAASEAWLG